MRIDRNLLGWGVFFIVVGAVPLAARAGLIAPETIDRWWSFWPLILVGLGLGLILTKTPFEIVGGLIVSATFGLMVGGALTGGIGGFGGIGNGVCGPGDGGTPFETRSGTLGPSAEVHLELDCGSLTASTSEPSGWLVQGSDEGGEGPRIESDDATLEVRTATDGPDFLGGDGDRLDVHLPTSSTLDLEIDVNAGQLDVDLAGGSITVVDLELNAGAATLALEGVREIDGIDIGVNAGNLRVFLPSLSMTGAIEANAGNVDLCAPPDAALRLQTGDSVLSAQDYGSAGLVQDGSTWETPGYDTAAVRIELRTEANVGSFSLNGEACGRG